MLHSWGLNIKPQEYDPIAAADGETGPQSEQDPPKQSTSSKQDDARTEESAGGESKEPASGKEKGKGSLLDLIRSELSGGSL